MTQAIQYAEFLSSGHLSIPKETVKVLRLKEGEKLRCLSDNENLIILKRIEWTWAQKFGKIAGTIQQDAIEKGLDKLSEDEIIQFVKELRIERTKRKNKGCY